MRVQERCHRLTAHALGLAVLLSSALAHAYEAPAELVLTLERSGSANLWLDLHADDITLASVAQTVRESLGCQISDREHEDAHIVAIIVAICPHLLQREAWVVSGRVELHEIVEAVGAKGATSLKVLVRHPSAGFSRSSLGERLRGATDDEVRYAGLFAVGASETRAPIEIEFGYRRRDVALWGLFLGLVLAIPSAVAWYLERRARLAPAAAAAGHRRYVITLRWATWVTWVLLLLVVRYWDFLSFVLPPGRAVVRMLLLTSVALVPPALATAVAEAMLAPIGQRSRGTTWNATEVFRQVIWRQSSIVLPLTLFATGLFLAKPDHLAGLLPWVAAALIVGGECGRRLAAAHQFLPAALTFGDLRDRAFELARGAGIALEQVCVLNGVRGKYANTFSMNRGFIMLTDYLIQNLSRAEVDGLVAHELAHLGRRRPLLLAVQAAGGWGLVIAFGLVAAGLGRSAGLLIVLALLTIFALPALRRRSERRADIDAASMTGDPEALIRALVKADQLTSDPATVECVGAIAQAYNIPEARLAELRIPAPASEPVYSTPPGILANETVYSSADRHRRSHRHSRIDVAVMILAPALTALLTQALDLSGIRLWAAYGAGFLAALGVLLVLDDRLPVAGYSRWRRDLEAKARSQGIQPAEWGGIFVGFSPDDGPRIYDGNGDWDLGFLFLSADRLCYWGERTSFAIQRDDLMRVRPGPGIDAFWPTERVYLTWRDTAGERRTVNVRPAAARSMRAVGPLARSLASRLDRWRTGAEADAVTRETLPDLPALQVRVVTGHPSQSNRPALLFRLLLWSTFLAASTALALGLRFAPSSPRLWLAPGAYVVASSLLLGLFQWLPVRLIKGGRGRSKVPVTGDGTLRQD